MDVPVEPPSADLRRAIRGIVARYTIVPHDVALIYAHPYPNRSHAGQVLLEGVREMPGVAVRTIYSLYPDFAIDVAAEQHALAEASVVVWQSPLYWYGVPALLHLWFEKVLAEGWAYGPGGRALAGKHVLWVTTTGAPESAYRPSGVHGYTFDRFVPPVEQTARFCGMRWSPPIVVHAAHQVDEAVLRDFARTYRETLEALIPRGGASELGGAAAPPGDGHE